jgi:hypothetical protein
MIIFKLSNIFLEFQMKDVHFIVYEEIIHIIFICIYNTIYYIYNAELKF